MTDEEDLAKGFLLAAFGDTFKDPDEKVVGSGISETTRISIRGVEAVARLTNPPPPWSENRQMVVELFSPIFDRSHQCPGREMPQCCQAGTGQSCFPNWREREDSEWYAQQINIYLSRVNGRIGQRGQFATGLTADEAFELGCLFTEARLKFQWDVHAKRGETIAKAAKSGGDSRRSSNPARRSTEETARAVEALLGQGIAPMNAYRRIAKSQGIKPDTVRKEYKAANKSR